MTEFIGREFLHPLASKYIYINWNQIHSNSISVRQNNVHGEVYLGPLQTFSR